MGQGVLSWWGSAVFPTLKHSFLNQMFTKQSPSLKIGFGNWSKDFLTDNVMRLGNGLFLVTRF